MKKRILIYDDDEEILLLCKAILEKHGYDVKTVNHCNDVVADVQEIIPDLILMDLWIPELGGEVAAQILKNNPQTIHIPILLFSANADIDAIAKKVNADGYVSKPFFVKDFVATIGGFVQGTS